MKTSTIVRKFLSLSAATVMLFSATTASATGGGSTVTGELSPRAAEGQTWTSETDHYGSAQYWGGRLYHYVWQNEPDENNRLVCSGACFQQRPGGEWNGIDGSGNWVYYNHKTGWDIIEVGYDSTILTTEGVALVKTEEEFGGSLWVTIPDGDNGSRSVMIAKGVASYEVHTGVVYLSDGSGYVGSILEVQGKPSTMYPYQSISRGFVVDKVLADSLADGYTAFNFAA